MQNKFILNLSSIIFGTFHTNEKINTYTYFSSADGLYPSVDIVMKGRKIYIWAEVPGVSSEDINVFFYDDSLVICGIKNTVYPERMVFFRMEREKTPFFRTFKLTKTVKKDSVNASMENGVLFISWEYEFEE